MILLSIMGLSASLVTAISGLAHRAKMSFGVLNLTISSRFFWPTFCEMAVRMGTTV